VHEAKLGVGFVGAGAVTQAIHLPTLARLTDVFEVRHVYDVVESVAAGVAARVGARWSTSLGDVLTDPSVDVVAICSPHHLHAVQVISACQAGKRGVLCEKPFAVSPQEASEIAAVSAETGVPILVGAMHTFDPGWRAAVAAWGDLPASVTAIRSSIVLPPNPRFEDFATEVINRPVAGLPAAVDRDAQAQLVADGVLGLASHDLPLVRSMLGRFDDLEVLEARCLKPFGYQIVFTADGKPVELHAVMNQTWRPAWTFEAVAPDQILRVEFTPSYVHAGSAVSRLHRDGASTTFGPYASNGYEAEWRELGEIVRGTRQVPAPESPLEDLRFALALADAAADLVRNPHREDVLA
jgi:myo-inositol 2-dehydrogenase/D-chiro-inositol 1-dehydrogenase